MNPVLEASVSAATAIGVLVALLVTAPEIGRRVTAWLDARSPIPDEPTPAAAPGKPPAAPLRLAGDWQAGLRKATHPDVVQL